MAAENIGESFPPFVQRCALLAIVAIAGACAGSPRSVPTPPGSAVAPAGATNADAKREEWLRSVRVVRDAIHASEESEMWLVAPLDGNRLVRTLAEMAGDDVRAGRSLDAFVARKRDELPPGLVLERIGERTLQLTSFEPRPGRHGRRSWAAEFAP